MSARQARAAVLALLLPLARVAAGQTDLSDLAKDFFLSRTIEGASKHSEALSETPATATIITRDEIERYGFRTVADVLRFAVPGYTASTDRTWDYAGGRGHSLFEDFNTRILVMLDGHPMNEPWNNFSGIGREMLVPLELVERIEVVHGPSSLLYGGYSLYGMVNVVTRNGESLAGARVSLSAGTWDTWEAIGSYGVSGLVPGPDEDSPGTLWNVLGAAGYYRSRGEDLDLPLVAVGYPVDTEGGTTWGGPQSGTDFEHAPFGFVKASLGTFSLIARAGYRDKGEVFGKYGAMYGSTDSVRRDSKDMLELRWKPKLAHGLEASFRAFGDRYAYSSRTPYANGGYYPGVDSFHYLLDAETWDLGGEAGFTLRKGVHLVTAGIEYRYRTVKDSYGDVRVDTGEPLSPPVEREKAGHLLVAYLQEEWRPVDRFAFVLGATLADTRPGATRVLPRFAVIYKPHRRLAVKALYGFGFRAPSLYEAENQAPGVDLAPEEMRSTELSLLWDVSRGVAVQAYAFDSRLSGLIQYDATVGEGGYRSLDDVPSHGAGLSLQGRFGRLHGYLNAAWAKALREHPGSPDPDLPGSSEWLASGGLSLDLGEVTASAVARWVGPQELDPAFYETGTAGDFFEANLRVQWKTRLALYPLTLTLDVRNLFDSQGSVAASPAQVLSTVPIPGRSALLGCEVRF
jgi:iron complex outermembrane receptor protein